MWQFPGQGQSDATQALLRVIGRLGFTLWRLPLPRPCRGINKDDNCLTQKTNNALQCYCAGSKSAILFYSNILATKTKENNRGDERQEARWLFDSDGKHSQWDVQSGWDLGGCHGQGMMFDLDFEQRIILKLFQNRQLTPLLNWPIGKNCDPKTGILHIVRDP